MDTATETPALPQVTFKKRGKSANLRKRPATPPPASDSEDYSSEDESGQRVRKRRRKTGAVTASSLANPTGAHDLSRTEHTASRTATIASVNDATKHANWYEEYQKDDLSAAALLGSTRAKPPAAAGADAQQQAVLDGTYKGSAAYSSFLRRQADAPARGFGPMKAATNIRTVTITDFAPDVCKDYKQTGFCGFGDSCKFLHAREDYKQGWALDRDWEASGAEGRAAARGGTVVASADRGALLDTPGKESREEEEERKMLEKIPFKCVLCKGDYKNPVLTKCGHYYCEKCALAWYRKTPECRACGKGTGGVFNAARDLGRLLERKRAREERAREDAKEKESASGSEAEQA